MAQLQVFQHPMFQSIRFSEINGKPFAVGVDVARALEYSNPSKAVIDHCKGITKLGIPSAGGYQETNMVSEGDIYRLIVKAADQSRNPEIKAKAEEFEKWVFDDVLPSIRQHGAYMTEDTIERTLTDPDYLIRLATTIKQERAEKERERQGRLAAEAKIEADRSKVLFAESLQISQDSILVNDLSKLLKQNGVDTGEQRLFKWLRDNGYLIKSGSEYNMPTQRSMDLKLFEVKVTTRQGSDGSPRLQRTPKVTGKGQLYFMNKFLGPGGISA